VPLELIRDAAGLVRAVDYLDAPRTFARNRPRRHAVPHSAVMERRASVRLFMALLPPEDPD
jgi:hypothetical protein